MPVGVDRGEVGANVEQRNRVLLGESSNGLVGVKMAVVAGVKWRIEHGDEQYDEPAAARLDEVARPLNERLALLPTMRRGLETGVESAAPTQTPFEGQVALIQRVEEVARPVQRRAE